MKYFIFIVLLCVITVSYSQETQWATKVIDFSSQLSDYEYAAAQALGVPNVLPNAGDNPNAWLPNKPDKISFIKVGFDEPTKIRQLAIAESYNPGSIFEIYLYDAAGKEYLLHQLSPRQLTIKGRLLNVYIGETSYFVSAVKVVIDGSKVPGYNAIDAIGISGSRMPIRAEKTVALRKNPGLPNNSIFSTTKGVSDSRPLILRGQNTLYFTRSFSPQNIGEALDYGDVWRADFNKSNDSFGEPVRLGENINNIGYNTVNVITDNSERLLLGNISGKINKEKANVVIVEKSGDDWDKISEQKIKNAQIASYDADYLLTENNTVLIIATQRFDTEGGRDLYISLKESDNKWSEPKNLGGEINTAHNEYAPYYSSEEKALYFSTAGYSGFGEGDIFRVVKLDDSWTSWTAPENIGGDVNTEADENYYSLDEDGKYAYFARSDPDSSYHIMRIEMPQFFEKTPMVVLKGKVLDQQGNPVSSSISINILPEKISYGIVFSDGSSGDYQIELPSGNQYHLKCDAPGYVSSDISISLENKNRAYGYELDINLKGTAVIAAVPVILPDKDPDEKEVVEISKPEILEPEVSKPIEKKPQVKVDEVLFAFGSDQPEEEAYVLLDRIADFLLKRTEVKVEIAGFTDHIGNELFNSDLALRRALTVKKYLIDKGIAGNRIRAMSFGEKMPVIISENKLDLTVNRRVEFNFTKY